MGKLLSFIQFAVRASFVGFVSTITSLTVSACDIDSSEFGPAIVQIAQGGNFSTGVVVDTNRVLTVAHAIDWGEAPVEITANIRGQSTEAVPLLVYQSTDLALLKVDTGSITPIPVATNDLAVDESIWVSGYPLGRARTVESGQVATINSKKIVSSALVMPGVSGGGLVRCVESDGTYELAGIVTSYLATVNGDTTVNSGKSVSLRIAYIRDLMEASARQLNTKQGMQLDIPRSLATHIHTSH